jgi:hypothetical protein
MFDLNEYSKKQLVEALEKVKEQYPAVYKHFFFSEVDPEMYAVMDTPYSPFNRNDPRNHRISKKDYVMLTGGTVEEDEKDT